ncbi:hypothetical protein YB2330_005540 [Saitoella coloradoensis]
MTSKFHMLGFRDTNVIDITPGEPTPKSVRPGVTVRSWDINFPWTEEHVRSQDLEMLRWSCDAAADEALAAGYTTLEKLLDEGGGGRDTALFKEATQVPEWVDWEQIRRGQDVFYRYAGAFLTALLHQSLLGGFGAGRITEVLARTGGFSVKTARKRLFETTQHILQCTRDPDALKPLTGEGWLSTLRVRLLHARVRNKITTLTRSNPSYYDIDKCGIPINDGDSIATIISFSSSITHLSFPRMFLYLRPQEIEDYFALWRLIAFYIGCPTDPFKTASSSVAWMQSIYAYEINPHPELSPLLVNNCVEALRDRPPAYTSAQFTYAQVRWLNGPTLSDQLGVTSDKIGLWYRALSFVQFIVVKLWIYTNRSVPSWDMQKVAMLRRILWKVIVEDQTIGLGQPTTFDFVHVPQFGKMTEAGTGDGEEELKKIKMEEAWKPKRSVAVLRLIIIMGVLLTMWVGKVCFTRLVPRILHL